MRDEVRSLQERWHNVCARVAAAAERSGRRPDEVTVIAVSKGTEAEKLKGVKEAGINHLGENRVQEAEAKISVLDPERSIHWHLIGRLQTNKLRYMTNHYRLIHSLDRESLAVALNRWAERSGQPCHVLVQVNTSGEAVKAGYASDEAFDFVLSLGRFPWLRVEGLMTMAPQVTDPEETRPCFAALRELSAAIDERLQVKPVPNVVMRHLSMGMSQDYEIAVEEGSTLVRVGRAIFPS